MNSDETINHDEKELIRLHLLGRRVISVNTVGNTGYIELDDGSTLELHPNIGGCACGAGDYELTELNTCDNMIMNVEFEDNPGGDYQENYDGYYRIFVFAENEKIKLMEIQGSDGNGYYGTGYWIAVK